MTTTNTATRNLFDVLANRDDISNRDDRVGYIAVRDHTLAVWGDEMVPLVAATDAAVLDAAEDLGWSEDQLFNWANSKAGRRFACETFRSLDRDKTQARLVHTKANLTAFCVRCFNEVGYQDDAFHATHNVFDHFANHDDFGGFGYIGGRLCTIGSVASGEREAEYLDLVAATDAAVLDAAHDLGWSEDQLFEWANSKAGRWFADGTFGNGLDEARAGLVVVKAQLAGFSSECFAAGLYWDEHFHASHTATHA